MRCCDRFTDRRLTYMAYDRSLIFADELPRPFRSLRARLEFLSSLVKHIDCTRLSAAELRQPWTTHSVRGPVSRSHGRIHRLADLAHVSARTLRLSDSVRSLVLRLNFIKQPHILDGDDGLVGEGLEQFDLLVGERLHSARRSAITPMLPFSQQWARSESHGSIRRRHFRAIEEIPALVAKNIGNMNRFPCQANARPSRPSPG